MLAEYVQTVIHNELVPSSIPPFFDTDYGNTPGSCVCNLPEALTVIYNTGVGQCSSIGNPLSTAYTNCLACLPGQHLAELQSICPNNSLVPVGINSAISQAFKDAQSDPVYKSSNWHNILVANCPSQTPPQGSAGYLNPLSLPDGFPATAPLSNRPDIVTSLAQFNLTQSTIAWTWYSGSGTTTFTFSSYTAAAATGGTSTTAGVVVSTISAQVTTISGQVTTVPATVVSTTKSNAEKSIAPIAAPLGLLLGLAML
ncbi:hypothetical protein AMS68_006716 [Peltaster fructicola]|uniref:Uncharacterized protein n=1 Tax=Peltaster fructicola TaxID=286661 RepID=A0A6H0Y2W8_9PEZI|nr:hypothetical protein AMS68_006716 [Peltaster fructicola]